MVNIQHRNYHPINYGNPEIQNEDKLQKEQRHVYSYGRKIDQLVFKKCQTFYHVKIHVQHPKCNRDYAD